MPFLPIDDIELYYELVGDGPPVLLLPGLLTGSESWMPNIRAALGSRHRLILPDPRGSGRTRPDDREFALTDITDDCRRLLDHLGVERAHLVGHSLGGVIAADFAARFPDRTDRVVTVCTALSADKRFLRLFEDVLAARQRGEAAAPYYRFLMYFSCGGWAFEDRATLDALSREIVAMLSVQSLPGLAAQVAALGRLPAGAFDLSTLKAPLLAISGIEDRIFSQTEVEATFAPAHDARFVAMAGVAHEPFFEQPEAVVDLILTFLSD